uniref:phenylalanine--tRNA ligase n=1 Tax=Dunaliella tertiolecta TaxID=3047 RepID=A0A7S3VJY5_DUNTE|mmetsp:Transcript_26594/g.71931  ORF Transcript_26594/g.71931 Transcript_26594/m.71931 type:complete len:497 (-) Transcript_26594:299-1789(-)
MAEKVESLLLKTIHERNGISDSGEFASGINENHNVVVGQIKSLQASEMVLVTDIDHFRWALTDEALNYLHNGSPEVQVLNAIPAEGLPMADLKAKVHADVADIGFKQAMQQKWLSMDKSSGAPRIVRKVDAVEDKTQQLLQAVAANKEISKPDAEAAKKRKLIKPEQWKTYKLDKGPKFALERKKPATELTQEMLAKGTWRTQEFKDYNFNALGQLPQGGHLHPLMKVRTQFRKIFTQMGFSEMPTNNYVESSFWNFDALFQPQQHPARDAHDTFFLTKPSSTSLDRIPQDYLQRVRDVHQHGGYGSAGYGYSWKKADAEKNLLRTHTTAVSSRMLYNLAQTGFQPARFFSVDRVFRNEAIDRTHLAEFHQVEGLVCDRGLTLGDLIGVLHEFFTRLGLPKLRFKPAYNPYTEPSMEIFSYSEQLKKWMEVGNSGMFRPEMLRPMGLPEDVSVIAWGLSLERPTMILYGIDNIRDLFGHKVNLSMIKRNPICRLGL